MHTPLMLQTVRGLNAERIAGGFLVSPKTMGQRLSRAKTKIRDGGIRFEVPEQNQLPQRLDAVLEAIYAAFGIGWRECFFSSCPAKQRFGACWRSCSTVKRDAPPGVIVMAVTFPSPSRTRNC